MADQQEGDARILTCGSTVYKAVGVVAGSRVRMSPRAACSRVLSCSVFRAPGLRCFLVHFLLLLRKCSG
ncbi:hypothetical protein AGIG_G6417 [Arapaima gigas]